jgi:hypothetical protein
MMLVLPAFSFSQTQTLSISTTPTFHSIFSNGMDTLFVQDDSIGRAMMKYWTSRIPSKEVIKKIVTGAVTVDLDTWELNGGEGTPKYIIVIDLICVRPASPGEKSNFHSEQLLK